MSKRKSNFKEKVVKGFLILLAGFFLFFFIHFIYSFLRDYSSNQSNNYNISSSINFDFANDIKNYATRSKKQGKTAQYNENTQNKTSLEQKYEKIASISSKTEKFDEDEKKIKDAIKKYDALIQFEQNSGVKGSRYLNMSIGVDPDKFNDMKEEIRQIGEITAIKVNKTDKTNEYKNLQATRTSLVSTKESLISLKEKGGSIEELIKLENRILDIEQQIQGLGVNLGEYDDENEFCTIKISLKETTQKPSNRISLIVLIKNSLEWAVIYYGLFIVILFFISLTALIIITVLEKLKWIPKAIDNDTDENNT